MLGKVLEEYMERIVEVDPNPFASTDSYAHDFLAKRQKLHELLGKYGLKYLQGGKEYNYDSLISKLNEYFVIRHSANGIGFGINRGLFLLQKKTS